MIPAVRVIAAQKLFPQKSEFGPAADGKNNGRLLFRARPGAERSRPNDEQDGKTAPVHALIVPGRSQGTSSHGAIHQDIP
jgi:hypothetical protein